MKQSVRIGVIGAGLGGATLGGLLQRAGFDVRVFEQAPAFERIGAGIHLTANVMKVLRHLGVERTLSDVGLHPDSFVSRKWDDGSVLFQLPLGKAGEEAYGATYITVHRGDLHAAIISAMQPGTVEFGKKLLAVDRAGGALKLEFADGSEAEFDALIGADGVNSCVRQVLLGPDRPRYTGHVAHRAIYPSQLLTGLKVHNCTKWWGPKSHILIYYITKARNEIYLVTSAPQAEWNETASFVPCSRDEVLAAFEGFHTEVREVIARAPQLTKWPIFDREPLDSWTDGNITMIGDACHPMRPYMAQGAAMAIEDAAILSRCFATSETSDVAEVFALYEANRMPRTREVQRVSLSNTFLREPTDPSWAFGYDAITVPLRNSSVKIG
jgi:6-hydroxynicotinate 3-monooxygenase